MVRPKGLGRGLDALLSGTDDQAQSHEALQTIAIDRLRPGRYQPRTRMDESALDELAESIREQGVMQPILVRPVDGNAFEIIAGERRWRAARRAGLKEVPALVKQVPDHAALVLALIENIQREDLNPLEQAQGLQRLIDEFGLTHDAAAKAVGRSRSAVSNLLRLAQLAPPVQNELQSGALEMGHARALLALPLSQQGAAAARVVERGMSVRQTEKLVRSLLQPKPRARRPDRRHDPDTARLEAELSETLGANVTLESGANGSGKLVIAYASLDQLDGILMRLR